MVVPAYFVLKSFVCFFFSRRYQSLLSQLSLSCMICRVSAFRMKLLVMPPFAQILILVKSCTFQHGLLCFLCKRYVLILTIKIWCNWKRKFSFTEFLVCSNGFHYTCFVGVFLKAVIYFLSLLLFLIMQYTAAYKRLSYCIIIQIIVQIGPYPEFSL